jgi:hypothetical protein
VPAVPPTYSETVLVLALTDGALPPTLIPIVAEA